MWLRWRAAIALSSLFLLGRAETLLMPIAFTGLLLALALTGEHPLNPLRGKLIDDLGEISYATYMAHFLLFVAFKLAFVNAAHNVGPGQLAAFLAATLAASIVLHPGVKRPAPH